MEQKSESIQESVVDDKHTSEVTLIDQSQVPEGVDLSEPVTIPEGVDIKDISLVTTEEDLLNLTVQRIVDLDENDPIYEEISSALISKAKPKWYKKGDFEVFKIFIREYPGLVYKHFDDLRELKVSLVRDKMKRQRRRRGK